MITLTENYKVVILFEDNHLRRGCDHLSIVSELNTYCNHMSYTEGRYECIHQNMHNAQHDEARVLRVFKKWDITVLKK